MRYLIVLLLIALASSMSACQHGPTDTVVIITTEYGEMVAVLYDETPIHKSNFIKLAKAHYYDGTLFHRVVKDFMIQGGDPDSKKIKPGERLANGGPGYTLPAEFRKQYYHEKGALAAARMVDAVNPARNSNGSQFYIVQGHIIPQAEMDYLRVDEVQLDLGLKKMLNDPANKPLRDSLHQLRESGDDDEFVKKIYSLAPRVQQVTGLRALRDISPEEIKAYTTVGGVPHLDNEYTVFGKVIKGLEIIDKIGFVPCDEVDRPIKDIPMTIEVKEMSKAKITGLYGYHYPDAK